MKSVIVISSYPRKKTIHGQETVGVASYAKNTLLSLRSVAPEKTNITVFAEKLEHDKNYKHQGIEVKRVWKRNSFTIFINLSQEILKSFRKTKIVIIEFELSMFGNLIHLLPFTIFLVLLKVFGKRIIVINHQVAPSIDDVGQYLTYEGASLRKIAPSVGIRLFYSTMLVLSSKVIVFEESLKNKLSRFGNSKKISVIPHGVESFNSKISKNEARKKLGIKKQDFVVVSFGYLAWHKGTDWLVHTISELKNSRKSLGKNIKLILAGGPNPNHKDEAYYTKYLQSITNEAEKNGIVITGFVPQTNIPLYYMAADVIVLPYRTYMSSSGPLSMAFSFKKPFLLANSLSGVLHQKDIQELLHEYRIDEHSIIFKESFELTDALDKLRKNANLRQKLSKLSGALAKKRDWKLIGKNYYEELLA